MHEKINQDWHPLLIRQVKRACQKKFNMYSEEWVNELFESISKAYYENDQERYLLERSMKISSDELLEINRRLENAQKIASLGYWCLDLEKNRVVVTGQLSKMLGINESSGFISYDDFYDGIHPDDAISFKKIISTYLNNGEAFTLEFRIYNRESKAYRWCYIKSDSFGGNLSGRKDGQIFAVIVDVTERKETELALLDVNKKLLTITRQAGKSEVAGFVLHNIGNILNSICVSIETSREIIEKSSYIKLGSIFKLMCDHLGGSNVNQNVCVFIEYINEVFNLIRSDFELLLLELNKLTNHISHIKDIVLLQSCNDGASRAKERISLESYIDLAVQLSQTNKSIANTKIIKDVPIESVFIMDKTTTLQVIVNLMRNAYESIESSKHSENGVITITCLVDRAGSILTLMISDNGRGIDEELISNIFVQGFTTKSTGHGLGLSSSKLSVEELGGSLSAESKGLGFGATFTLRLPIYIPTDEYGLSAYSSIYESGGIDV